MIKQWKKRWCVLVDLCLYCYEGKTCIFGISHIIPSNKGIYIVRINSDNCAKYKSCFWLFMRVARNL